jgi:hypothetical protein
MTWKRLVATCVVLLWTANSMGGVLGASISVDKSCYAANEAIVIRFDNGSDRTPLATDWVALYRSSSINPSNLGNTPSMWVWTCSGSQVSCSTRTLKSGRMAFGPGGAAEEESDVAWPLDAGTYRAVLSGGSRPYRSAPPIS